MEVKTGRMSYTDAEKLVLKDKKVIVRPLERLNMAIVESTGNKEHDGAFMFSKAYNDIHLGYSTKEGSLKKFLTPQEREAFEVLLQKESGDLSFYQAKGKVTFWSTFGIRLDKEDKILDLSEPVGALRYRLLLSDDKVCLYEEKDNKPMAKWCIVDEDKLSKTINNLNTRKIEAMQKYVELIGNPGIENEKLINVLQLLGKKVAKDSTLEFLSNELFKVIEESTNTRTRSNLNDFLKVMEDTTMNEKAFINKAVSAGLIKKTKNKYTLSDSLDTIGNNLEEAIAWVKDLNNSTTVKGMELKLKKV